ncbi:PBP1A family penicillin-binding protein [Bacillaceae bacterium Marseille-Q3522]|nr:PBP1A family penicillin-binding protein [Bacillaceae bacterium Marseille-Q3522]
MSEQFQSREERKKQLAASKRKKKGKTGKKVFFQRVFLIFVGLCIFGILAGVGTFAYMVKDAPELDESSLKTAVSSEVFDKNNNLIATLRLPEETREYVEYKNIPKLVEDAVIATEDSRFYHHHGVDPIRLGGAVLANITRGFGSEGGSTITSQVVKNYFLTPEKTISRKAQEAWLSIQLERKYSKQQIFEMYVNIVNMGGPIRGLATAADYYFGKELSELTLPEAALLAGMPQSPNNYNPFKNPDNAEKRRNIVLSLMNQHGYISKAQMEEAKKVPVTDLLLPEDQRKSFDLPYDSFIGQVIKEVEEKYPDLNVYTDGLKIHTTLDPKAQDYVDQVMYGNEIVPFPDEQFQAGITVLDTKTGGILALGGDRDPNVKLGLNYATSFPRQPGSTIKPVLDYGPAIEYLHWGTYETIVDEPHTYSDGTKFNNFDNKYLGPLTMRTALVKSRNIPAVKAIQEVGLEKARDFATGLGIPLEETIYEPYAIGGFADGVTTMQLAGAYSAFGNEGFYTEPHAVTGIELQDGTKIDMTPETTVAMNDYTAFMISDMLKDVLKTGGTGTAANIPGLPVAGKTGTTNYSDDELAKYNLKGSDVPDAWFSGYTTNFTVTVWTGYKERKIPLDNPEKRRVAQQIFKNVMTHISEGVETADFAVPSSVEKVRIEKGTNPAKLASEYTPGSEVLNEYAVKGNKPKDVSEKFDKLSAPSNVKANYDKAGNKLDLSWNYIQEEMDGVQFEVTVSVDGGAEQQLSSSSDLGLSMAGPDPGRTYSFEVTAVRGNLRSESATAMVKVPETESDRNQNNQGDNSSNNNGQNGNGNSNGNGNGNQPPGDNGGNTNPGDGGSQGGSDSGDGGDDDENPPEDGENQDTSPPRNGN